MEACVFLLKIQGLVFQKENVKQLEILGWILEHLKVSRWIPGAVAETGADSPYFQSAWGPWSGCTSGGSPPLINGADLGDGGDEIFWDISIKPRNKLWPAQTLFTSHLSSSPSNQLPSAAPRKRLWQGALSTWKWKTCISHFVIALLLSFRMLSHFPQPL